ncbi:hypothetical protein V7S43_003847 [Phytophthora oleae]|uniref:Transmembrane protein n=1 Tax=Phytophthora oleae TaxID=2107226 RepID=A0ABD3FXF5_9STRA
MTGINARLQRSADRFIRKWEAVQVELHGHYSVERFAAMNEYSRATSLWRAAMILPLSPLPCLVLVTLLDAIPLEAPDKGFTHSTATWIRATLTCFVYTHCAVEQIRLYSPNLGLTPILGLCISLPAAIITNALALALSALICYPLPFASLLLSGPWLGFTTFFLLRVRGAHMRANPEAVKDIVRFATICGAQVSIVMVYAGFNTIFTNMSPTYQPMFALLIPAFKVVQKNILSRILAGRDDTKPQVVILNVEIFNALFISNCMQNAQSIGTSITLISVDILQAAISLLDLYRMINDVGNILNKLGVTSNALISTAEIVLENYPRASNRRSMTLTTINSPTQFARVSLKKKQILPTMNMECGEYRLPVPAPQLVSLRDISRVSSVQSGYTDKGADISLATPTTDLNKLSSKEHYRLLKKSLQVLYLTEFMLLTEFTEVLVPVIYGGYLAILYHLPNRQFYPQLANLSDEELWHMIFSVLEYGILELASLFLLIIVLNRRVHCHSLKQLAFVLEGEFLMVQPKLILWVTMTLQSTLPQMGKYPDIFPPFAN